VLVGTILILQDTDHIITKGADRIEFVVSDPTHNTKKSRLTVPYANVTIVPMLDFSRGRKKLKAMKKVVSHLERISAKVLELDLEAMLDTD